MSSVLNLFKLVDGVQTPFPSVDSQVEIFDYTYSAKRMGGAPSITASIKYAECLDDVWDDTVHTEFNGEKYFLKQTPTSTKDNSDERYKHDAEFVSERIILDNVYFYDVVGDLTDYKPVTNSTKVVFFGTIQEFVERLNASLRYAKLQTATNILGKYDGYQVVIDQDIVTDGKLITFEDQFFSGVLQEIYKVYELPYYFKGKEIHIGFEQNIGDVVMPTFEYGIDNQLVSIAKTNANNKVVNRVTGVGSSENIPYYYPNMSEKGDLEAVYHTVDNSAVQTDTLRIVDADKYAKAVDTGTSLVYKEDVGVASFLFGATYYTYSIDQNTKNYSNDTIIYYNYSSYSSVIKINFKRYFKVDTVGKFFVPVTILQKDKNYTSWVSKFEIKNLKEVSVLSEIEGVVTPIIEIVDGGFELTATMTGTFILSFIYDVPYMGWLSPVYGENNNPKYETKVNIGDIENIKDKHWFDENKEEKYTDLRTIGLLLKDKTPKVGDKIIQNKISYIQPQETLMPPIYRESVGAERFYNAINYTGNKNLLVDTDKVCENRDYLLGSYDLGKDKIKLKDGDQVTISFSGDLGTGHELFFIYNSGWNIKLANITYSDYNQTTKRFVKTFNWRSSANGEFIIPTNINIFQADANGNRIDSGDYLNESRVASMIYDIKLEFGDVATDYDFDELYIENEETGATYNFPNPYADGKPKEQIVSFDDIKPTIVGMTNAAGQPIDQFLEIAFDENDNDEMEEIDGNLVYKHPYFFAKLPKTDGKHAFNLFESAIDEGEMTINMTSGHCGGCAFKVLVSEDDLKQNTVQVSDAGFLKRDADGNVICGREPYQSAVTGQERQQDTINNEVWIALEKDLETYGTIMPSGAIKPTTDDKFVITNIKLPQAYIKAAEERLGKEILKYMRENNEEKFTFTIKFSRIYLAENPLVASAISENSLLHIAYNGKTYPLYVSSYSYKVSSNDALPEITVELKDEITVSQNALQKAITEVKGDFLTSFKNLDILGLCSPYFLRKDVDDRSAGKISASMGFEAGSYIEDKAGAKIDEYGIAEVQKLKSRNGVVTDLITTKNYASGILGSGAKLWVDDNNKANLEIDNITARESFKITEFVIQKVNSVGGVLVVSATNGTITEVEEVLTEGANGYDLTGYKLTFGTDSVFANNDIIRCSYWDKEENTLRSYWCPVTTENGGMSNVVFVSVDAFEKDSEGVLLFTPKAGDKVAQMGNTTDDKRQGVIVISTENNKPFISIYDGINTASLDTSKLRGRFGDLSGITFNGKKLKNYGIWSDNAYFNGELVVSNGQTVEEAIASQAASRNLLLGTNDGVTNWSFSSSLNIYTTKSITHNGATGVQIIKNDPLQSAGWETISYPLRPEFIKKGKKYYLSFDLMQSTENSVGIGFNVSLSNKAGGNHLTNIVALNSANVNNIWQHFEVEFIAIENGSVDGDQVVYFNIYRSTNEWSDFAIVNLKLEEGSRATAWSPAPEDGVKTELKVLEDSIIAKVGDTGINIETGEITVSADKFTITNSNGKVTAGVNEYGDWSTNALHTKDSEGKKAITINEDNNNMQRFYYPNTNIIQMEMGWDAITASLMRYYDIDGNMLWQIGNEKGFMSGSASNMVITQHTLWFIGTFDKVTAQQAYLYAANNVASGGTTIYGRMKVSEVGINYMPEDFYFDAYLLKPVNGYLTSVNYATDMSGDYRVVSKIVNGKITKTETAWRGDGDDDIPEEWTND